MEIIQIVILQNAKFTEISNITNTNISKYSERQFEFVYTPSWLWLKLLHSTRYALQTNKLIGSQ